MLTYFSDVTLVSFLTVIWVTNVLSYGLCFHPDSVEISPWNLPTLVLVKLLNMVKVNDSGSNLNDPLKMYHRLWRV